MKQLKKVNNKNIQIMKRNFFNIRNAAMVLAVSALTTISFNSFAGKPEADLNANVTYVSADEAGTTFLVAVDAAAPAKFQLTVKDKAGEILFSRVFESAGFNKNFKLNNEELGLGEITFSVKNLDNGAVSNFKVSTEEKTVNEIQVVKSH
jgi:hypothetical protein